MLTALIGMTQGGYTAFYAIQLPAKITSVYF
jgi:hypothetical protein